MTNYNISKWKVNKTIKEEANTDSSRAQLTTRRRSLVTGLSEWSSRLPSLRRGRPSPSKKCSRIRDTKIENLPAFES